LIFYTSSLFWAFGGSKKTLEIGKIPTVRVAKEKFKQC